MIVNEEYLGSSTEVAIAFKRVFGKLSNDPKELLSSINNAIQMLRDEGGVIVKVGTSLFKPSDFYVEAKKILPQGSKMRKLSVVNE